MSKSVARVALPVLVSLVVIFAIFTTVQGASIKVAEKMGSHSVSGIMTNFNHDRLNAAEQNAYQAELDALNKPKSSPAGPGRGCEDEAFTSPLD